MPPPPPSPRRGNSFTSAKRVVSTKQRRGKWKLEDAGNINVNTSTCRERERKETSTSDEDSKTNTNTNNIVGNGRMPALFSASSKRRWLRGNRKKVFVESLIAFTALCFWISLFRFEYNAMQSPRYHNNTVYRKHKHSVENGPGDRNSDNQNDNDNGIVSRSSISIKSHAYDSIFCRANSFQMDKNNSSRSGKKISQHHQTTKPVFLWGIPSTTSEFETGRRTLLRKTYLDFYKRIHGDEDYQKTKAAANTANANRFLDNHPSNTMCSFHDWTCKAEVRADCQMIYVFFVGGHKSFHNNETSAEEWKSQRHHNNNHNHSKGGPPPPPYLLNESITDFREMLLSPDEYKDAKGGGFDFHEPGTVYLDIRENQFDGKMTTWFKFASLVATEYNTQTQTQMQATATANTVHPKIEYVFKVDSDLILFTPHFFHWFEGVHGEQQQLQGIKLPQQQFETTKSSGGGGLLPSTPALVHRVYGGIEFPSTNCVKNFTFDHPCPLPLSGPSYMSGELNFVSVDLAIYIASDDCPRDQWTIPHEDVSLSNYVYSYTNNTAYHKKREEIQLVGNRNTLNSNSGNNKNHSIHIVGVNTSKILLLPNMRANWETVSIRKNPDVFRSGELLWGHSIKRGNYTQYLYWKKDSKFQSFWWLFYKVYTRTGTGFRSSRRKKKTVPDSGNDAASIFRSAVQQKLEQNQQRKGTNTTGKRVGKDVGGLIGETKHVQAF